MCAFSADWAYSRSGRIGSWISRQTWFLHWESVGPVDNGVLIGGVYCIVDAGEPRLYMVGSRGVEGHGRREASAVGCCGKRCAVHVAIWLETMICGKQQAIRLRNLGVGIMHCGFWVSGHGCLVLGVGYWVWGVEGWVLGVWSGCLDEHGSGTVPWFLDWWKSGHTHFFCTVPFGR